MEELLAELSEQGYQSRVVSVQRLADLQREFEGHLRQGLIDQKLQESYLSGFTFSPPARLPEARSIIVVATPQPQYQVTFTWDGEPLHTAVPPTYPERVMDRHVRQLLRQVLEPAGYWLADAFLPKKLLAVRSGLTAYGRNNITYAPGMGSFFGLVTVFSDLPAPNHDWQEARMMERCEKCTACLNACPSGAIAADRFLLHAERCISFHNEKPGDVPFPAWIDSSWHNCLVGCLHCQRVCPENRQVREWVVRGAEFSQEETALLLERLPLDQLPATTLEKLKQQHLDAYAGPLPRNLDALLRRHH
jgi:epoxyqueuosine reductase